MMRPSNSGMAIPAVASYGPRPPGLSTHSSLDCPDDGAWMIGTSSAASALASHVVAVEPAGTTGGAGARRPTPPVASTVVIRTSSRCSRQQVEHGAGGVAAQRVAPHGERRRRRSPRSRRTGRRRTGCSRRRGGPGRTRRRPAVASDRVGPRPPHAVGRDLVGRVEAEALEQHGVGDEAQQVLEVRRAAVDEVGEGLGEDRAGHGRQRRELGVGHGLAGEGEERDAALDAAWRAARRTRPPSARRPPQQPDDHAGGAVEVAVARRTSTAGRPAPAGSRPAAPRSPCAGRGSRCRRW